MYIYNFIIVQTVIVIGAGFGGLNFLRNATKSKNIQFILIDKQNHHLFQPLLYQVATATLSPANIAFPVRRMFKNTKNVKERSSLTNNPNRRGTHRGPMLALTSLISNSSQSPTSAKH